MGIALDITGPRGFGFSGAGGSSEGVDDSDSSSTKLSAFVDDNETGVPHRILSPRFADRNPVTHGIPPASAKDVRVINLIIVVCLIFVVELDLPM